MAALRQTYTFVDHIGFRGQVKVRVTDLAAGSALVTPLDNCSNAIISGTNGPNTSHLSSGVYGINAFFANIEDKALFLFVDVNGNPHRYMIPAPLVALFQTDGRTLNLAQAAVVALGNAFIANVRTPEDTALQALVGGHRVRTHTRYRLPVSLNPTP